MITNLIVVNILQYICVLNYQCIPYTYSMLYVNYILIKLGKTVCVQEKKENVLLLYTTG